MKANSEQWGEIESHNSTSGFSIALAAFFGLSFAMGPIPFFPGSGHSIPLFEIFDAWTDTNILLVFKTLLIVAYIAFRNQRLTIFSFGVFILLNWMNRYSGSGAFLWAISISALFLGSTFKMTGPCRANVAALSVALIFLVSAVQKINSEYLSGVEFLSPAGFFYLFSKTSGENPFWYFPMLPHLSIALEFLIAGLILINSIIGIRIAIVTVLVFALIHPPAIYVYFMLFPFLISIDRPWEKKLLRHNVAAILGNPILWMILVYSVRDLTWSAAERLIGTWIVILFVFLYHLYNLVFLKSNDGEESRSLRFNYKSLGFRIETLATPVVILGSFIAFKMGAPVPIGFSMFSAQKHRNSTHQVEFGELRNCALISELFTVTSVADFTVETTQRQTCLVRFPTSDGVSFIRRIVCENQPWALWSVSTKGTADSETGRCR